MTERNETPEQGTKRSDTQDETTKRFWSVYDDCAAAVKLIRKVSATVDALSGEYDAHESELSTLRVENERLRAERAVTDNDDAVTIRTLTDQLREARETTTAVKRNHIVEAQRLIRERDAALAELARLRSALDHERVCDTCYDNGCDRCPTCETETLLEPK